MCPDCEDKTKSYCLRCRLTEYREVIEGLNIHQQNNLEHYRNIIQTAIYNATSTDDELKWLENFENIIEAYSFELTMGLKDELLTGKYSDSEVFRKAKRYTYKRKNSWYGLLNRQRDNIRVLPRHHVFVRDNGNVIDFAFNDSNYFQLLGLPNIYHKTPEKTLLEVERNLVLEKLPDIIAALKKKRAPEYCRILEALYDGVDVSSKHGPELNIEGNKVAGFKHQMIKCARKILAQYYPDLVERQNIYRIQKGKKFKTEKSTYKQRKKIYRSAPSPEKTKPRLLRRFRVIDGKLSLIKKPSYPIISANCERETDRANY